MFICTNLLLEENQIYAIGTVRKDHKQMVNLRADKKLKRWNANFYQFKNVICYKWYDNKLVLALAANVESMSRTTNVYMWHV